MIVPLVRRLLADDHAEQRRLAGAVRADDPDDPRPRKLERQVLDQQPVAVALAQVLDLDDLLAEARPGRDDDLELARGALVVRCLVEQLLVGGEARLALRLAGARREPHPVELAGQRARLGVGGLLLGRHARELLLQPAGVVAAERDALPAIQLEDPLRDVVEEVPIVGDGDDRARVLLEEALEPLDGLGVEVVRGLVEEQQVGMLEEQPARARRGASRRRRGS